MNYIFPVLSIISVIIAIGIWIRYSLLQSNSNSQKPDALTLLQNQINSTLAQTRQHIENLEGKMEKNLYNLSEQVSKNLGETNRTIGARWDNTARELGNVQKRLGQIDEANKRIFEVGKEMRELQRALKAPKLRGAMGEYMLQELLAQILPEHNFKMQYKFKSGEIVDAVIKLKAGMVAVDAKFPLDNFQRIISAEDEQNKTAAQRAFYKDVKKYIHSIASKYILPDEGTFDFAMMYIPAENVYYEIMLKKESDSENSLFTYAVNQRVIPVSPNSFYAYLQTILLGLRGLQVEETAKEIMNKLSGLQSDMNKFSEDFRLTGNHINNAMNKFIDSEKRLGRVNTKFEQITEPTKILQQKNTESEN
jgi:DNA recombination protein RmuC